MNECLKRGEEWTKNLELGRQNAKNIPDIEDDTHTPEGGITSVDNQVTAVYHALTVVNWISELGTKHDMLNASDASSRPHKLREIQPKPTQAMPASQQSAEKRFPCTSEASDNPNGICNKSFSHKSSLSRHQREAHNAAPKKAGRPRKS